MVERNRRFQGGSVQKKGPKTGQMIEVCYDCPSATIRTNRMPEELGQEIPFVFSYWVNVNESNGKKAPWASNKDLDDSNPLPSWTRFVELGHPSELMSIADVAQNEKGLVGASGAFKFYPHFYDGKTPDPPSPYLNTVAGPEDYIGPITPTEQGQRASMRGIFNFRHSVGINTVFFDGHVENILNGGVKKKNILRE